MADLELPGLSSARAALTKLGKTPGNMQGPNARGLRRQIVRELYTEIRSSRIAGHSWKKIAKVFAEAMSVPMSNYCLRTYFNKIDLEYEKETGVAALPRIQYPANRRGRPRKEKSEG